MRQRTICNLSKYAYQHFELLFVTIATLVNSYLDLTKCLPQLYPNLTITQSVHFIQIFVAIFAYYADIMLNAFATLLCSILCWHNKLKPTRVTRTWYVSALL